MSSNTRRIVVAGVMSAISMFLGWTHLGFIPWITGAALTPMHIPAILGSVLEGPVVGAVIGLIFGVFSLWQAAVAPTGVIDPAFTNPLVSVLPRLLIGPVAWLAYKALKDVNQIGALALAGLIGSVTNTAGVLGMGGLLHFWPWPAIGVVAVGNGVPEAIVAAIVTVAVVTAWKRIETGRKGSSI